MTGRTYTDQQLRDAVSVATSWRGVLRGLGLRGTSGATIRSVRDHASHIGVSHDHFTGARLWTDEALWVAIRTSESWAQVVARLGAADPTDLVLLRSHAARLRISTEHLESIAPEDPEEVCAPDLSRLDRAGSLIAASWFALCGFDVSWPLEPARYDLLIQRGRRVRRIQVKTTTSRSGATWKVYLSTARRDRRVYSPEEIDEFFIIDGDLGCYVVPLAAVGGLHAIHLSAYEQYRVQGVLEVRKRSTS